jgi:hypothetical protein
MSGFGWVMMTSVGRISTNAALLMALWGTGLVAHAAHTLRRSAAVPANRTRALHNDARQYPDACSWHHWIEADLAQRATMILLLVAFTGINGVWYGVLALLVLVGLNLAPALWGVTLVSAGALALVAVALRGAQQRRDHERMQRLTDGSG